MMSCFEAAFKCVFKRFKDGDRKLSQRVLMNGLDEGLSPIPGSHRHKLFQVVKLVKNGHLFFLQQSDLYNSNVFRCNFFGASYIAVIDFKGIKALFDTNKVEKEPGFGNFRFNKDLLDGYIPSMFTNGEQHIKQKEFLIKIARSMKMQTLLPTILDIMPEHLIKWNFKEGKGTATQEEWEERILLLSSDIMSETLLGIRLDGEAFLNWRFEVLKKTKKDCKGQPKGKHRIALGAFEHLQASIANSPNIDRIYKTAAKYGLSEEEAVLEILWMLNFNAGPGTGAAMRSAAARISIMSEKEKDELRQEIKTHLGTIGLNLKTLKKMKKLDAFTMEVLRIHPPVALYFAKARKSFVLESNSGKFRIRKGERLLGNCHIAQRDPSEFIVESCKGVDEFDYTRFLVNPALKSKVLCSHGMMSESPTPNNHKCAGAHVGIITLKTFILYLILFCDWELEEKPYWTRTTLIRYGNPDEPIRLKTFKYTRDKEELLLPDEQSDSGESTEDELDGCPDLRCPIPHNMQDPNEEV
ncbi:9-divinyl ether synthase-like isoform X2 [Actinia tenebrosa]|uniref:9-divinyl ether synthase-like isoform X2 n=1 Tax=Actinia tenebrosa TaxID=6105 RepID=A0A6P8I9M9_ACTTE|nr:9-divinyl ether synthase-like isoform X2 [Actinia tenebrosa]